MKISEIVSQIDRLAPIDLSKKSIETGYYDNSGLLIDMDGETDSVVFTLDLCYGAVELAKKVGAKLIVTHHPAIYHPIKTIGKSPIAECMRNGISVMSNHLNLDIADEGVEYSLAKIVGAKHTEVLEKITETNGFGRIFEIEPKPLESVVNEVIGALNTKNYMLFKGENKLIKKVATFCGGGLREHLINMALEADLLISADISHHVLSHALDMGKSVLQLTHYASEYHVFNKLIENLNKEIKINCHQFVDHRFL